MHGGVPDGKARPGDSALDELTTAARDHTSRTMAITLPRSRASILLLSGLATFVLALVFLVASSLVRRSAPVFDPTPIGVVRSSPPSGVDTLTVDARDERLWRFVDLGRGVVSPASEASAWDLVIRRHDIGASGAIADAGEVQFEAVRRAPAGTYIATSGGRDTVNAAIRRWYRYGMVSHLLEPNGHVYVVRTRAGGHIKLEILSYYCRGMEGGCLTFRYATVPPP
jgi:hypothetical protein